MNKHVLAGMMIIACAGMALAQSPTDRGVFNISGGLSFSTTATEDVDDNVNMFTFTPGLYVFVFRNLAVGGTFTYNNMMQGDFGYSTIGIGPGIRFFLNMGSARLFFSTGFSYTYGKYKGATDGTTGTDISLGAGFDFFLAKNVALEPFVRYHIMSSKYDDMDSRSQKQLEVGIGIGIFAY